MTSEEWDEMLESIPLKFPPKDFDILFDDQEGEEEPFIYKTPTAEDIEEQNHYLLRRQKVFRMAAEYFAHEASRIPWVLRIALIGSVAQPLEKQVPRFRDYRRAGIKVWHECKDVDVAVWVNQLSDLNALRRARSQAVNELSRATEGLANVAHHQLDVFILDYARNLYMGNVCIFKSCPNGKDECYAQGCGAAPFLQRYDGFQFHDDAVYPDRIKILFDRSETDNGKNESIWDRPDDDEVPF